jgi:C4-dicarboxylate transporter DctM subunit
MILVGGKILAHIITFLKIPHQLMSFLLEVNLSSWAALAVIIVFLLILGMFMEVISLIIITVPILHPLVLHYGWDNVWFGIIIMCCVNIALITPPVGGTLFIISQIGEIDFGQVLKGVFPFILLMIFVLMLIAMFPILATWLPGLMSAH